MLYAICTYLLDVPELIIVKVPKEKRDELEKTAYKMDEKTFPLWILEAWAENLTLFNENRYTIRTFEEFKTEFMDES